MTSSLAVLAEAGMAATSLLGNGMLLACLVGCVVLAWRQGFFFATLLGMGLLVAFVSALAGAGGLAEWLVDLGLPTTHAPVTAFALIFAGGVIALGMALSQWVPEQAVWNGGLAGRLIGIAAAAAAAFVLAGSILVGWSMADLPEWLALQQQQLVVDAGRQLLTAAGRFVEPDRDRREAVLGGWQRFVSDQPGIRPACSEPFVDTNGNCMRDDHERYLDVDGNGRFTALLPAPGAVDAAQRWSPGMLDCYVLKSWSNVMASHPPRLTSAREAAVDVSLLGDGLYQALASDPDPCDRLGYGIRQPGSETGPALIIDPETGRVDLTDAAIQEVLPVYEFTVTATDQSGLVAELPVRVRVRNLPAPSGR